MRSSPYCYVLFLLSMILETAALSCPYIHMYSMYVTNAVQMQMLPLIHANPKIEF
jgi:hypothetical protein